VDVPLLIERLERAYPDAACALVHQDPFQLLVATILSAQCTDERVNKVTPGLFAEYPDARAMAGVSQERLEEIIRSTGFFRNKAKAIRGASTRLVEAFEGLVPRTMEELLTLSGVARKTANVVLGVGFGIAVGVVVDTHVDRIAKRLGLSRGKNAEEVERDLMVAIPQERWIEFSHLLIFHGRRTCQARRPMCAECPVRDLCPSAPYFLAGKTPPLERRGGRARAAAGVEISRRKRRPARAAKRKVAARARVARKHGVPARRKATARRPPARKRRTGRSR
jgi:endonuclease-3